MKHNWIALIIGVSVLAYSVAASFAPGIPYPPIELSATPPTNHNKYWMRQKDHHTFEFREDRGSWVSVSPVVLWNAFNGAFDHLTNDARFGQAIDNSVSSVKGILLPQDGFIQRAWLTSEADNPTWCFIVSKINGGSYVAKDTVCVADMVSGPNTANNCGYWITFSQADFDSGDVLIVDPYDTDGDGTDDIEDFAIFLDYRFEVR